MVDMVDRECLSDEYHFFLQIKTNLPWALERTLEVANIFDTTVVSVAISQPLLSLSLMIWLISE